VAGTVEAAVTGGFICLGASNGVSNVWRCRMLKAFAFLKDESGATAIEYCLIAAGISIVIIASANAVGTSLTSTFGTVSTQLK
jgi:pilus assembly protein Flp/PilA